jgi:mersacidin/lichenicidin family type 2 lantibiotic
MDIIRAWKDAEYRNSLSEAERAALPPHPAGLIALTDEDLGAVAGGRIAISNDGDCPGGPTHAGCPTNVEYCSHLCLTYIANQCTYSRC